MAVHAGRAVFEQGIDDPRGNAQRGVLVYVYLRGTNTPATLYTDRTKAETIANPITTNGLGNVAIFADPGEYDAMVNGATLRFTVLPDWEDVLLTATPEAGLPAHLADAVDAHDASAVSFSPAAGIAATDVQAALVEVAGDVASDVAGLGAHLADAADAHDASSVSVVPVGGIAATDVQAALAELDSEKEPSIPPGTYVETAKGPTNLTDWTFVKDPANPILADGSDETAKLNYWTERLPADGGPGRIILPDTGLGHIAVSDSILIHKAGTVFVGPNRAHAKIRMLTADKSVFKGADDLVRYTHCGFENVYVDALVGVGGVRAFDFTRLGYTHITNCMASLAGPGSKGIYVQDAADGSGPYYCTSDNFYFSSLQADSTGIYFGLPTSPDVRSANAWSVRGGRISCGGVGVVINGHGNTFTGVVLEGFSVAGYQIGTGDAGQLNDALGNTIIGGYAETGAGAPEPYYVDFGPRSSGNQVVPGYITGVETPWYRDQSGANVVHGYGATMVARTKPSSSTLTIADAGTVMESTGASSTLLTVPPNSSVAYPLGTIIEFVQMGTGVITINPGAGVTLLSNGSRLRTSGQYASGSLRKTATDTWVVAGDLTV